MNGSSRSVILSAGSMLVLAGCFAPSVDGDVTTSSDASDGSTSEASSTSTDTTGSGSTNTSAPDTGSDASDPSTTTSPTSTSSGEDHYCGDGIVDEGEECDDGLDNNGLEQSCLPDCNLNVCGDSNVGPDEACDDGKDDNILAPGACAPDCSRIIETREIVVSNFKLYEEDGDFGPNPVATADAMCPTGYRALVAVPGERQVTNTPNRANAVVDWPLRPFTAYSNVDGEIVWVTDVAPLLGVRDGLPESLEAAISATDFLGGPYVITGLRQDWTSNTAENCNNFSSTLPGIDLALGTASNLDLFLDGGQFFNCDDTTGPVLCVEQ